MATGVAGSDAASRAVAYRLLAAAVAGVIGAAVCYLLLVRTSLGQRFDNAAYLGARQSGSGAQAASNQLRRITGDSFAVVLLVLVGIGIVRRKLLLGVGAAVAAGVAVIGTDALKSWVLTRPDLTSTDGVVPGNTFPSGHTATAVACALALMLVSPPRWRGAAAVVAGAYAWITAAQVQTAGWHRPSDALGAALLAFASVAAVGAALAWWRPGPARTSRPHRLALTVLGVIAVADAIAGGVELSRSLRWLTDPHHNAPATSGIRYDSYLTGLTATILVVVVVVMALLALLGRVDLDRR